MCHGGQHHNACAAWSGVPVCANFKSALLLLTFIWCAVAVLYFGVELSLACQELVCQEPVPKIVHLQEGDVCEEASSTQRLICLFTASARLAPRAL